MPRHLVDEVNALAPADLHGNLNRLVTTALQAYAAAQKQRAFENAMAQMAADPAMRVESEEITRRFAAAERDGLRDD